MKKGWIFVSLLVGVLALGIVGGTALAQEQGTDTDTPVSKFAAKVASILGLDETQVEDALKQAARETQDEALQAKLAKLVENGRLTQEQADAYLEWYRARPEGPIPGFGRHGFGGHGFMRGGMMRGHDGMMGGYGGNGTLGPMGGNGGHGMMGPTGPWGTTYPAPETQSFGTTTGL